MITITDAAATKIENLILSKKNPDLRLRLYIVGGGCSGFKYGFGLDDKQNEDDIVIEKNAIQLIVDALSLQYLTDATVDYREDLVGAQFSVHNPNAQTTCGCGSSFSL